MVSGTAGGAAWVAGPVEEGRQIDLHYMYLHVNLPALFSGRTRRAEF